MDFVRSDYTRFIDYRNSTNAEIHYLEYDDLYLLYLVNGNFKLRCDIKRADPKSADEIDFETNYKADSNTTSIKENGAFASKSLPNGKKLFKRVHGISASLNNETKNIEFVIPYANCKITDVEIINGSLGDKCNFKILDTPTGTISTIPNYMLNQFAYDLFVAKDYHLQKSQYDADLIQNLKVVVEYTTTETKDVYINFTLHEVK